MLSSADQAKWQSRSLPTVSKSLLALMFAFFVGCMVSPQEVVEGQQGFIGKLEHWVAAPESTSLRLHKKDKLYKEGADPDGQPHFWITPGQTDLSVSRLQSTPSSCCGYIPPLAPALVYLSPPLRAPPLV